MSFLTRPTLIALALLFTLLGCSKTQTPEERVRAMIAQAEQAAERKESGKLRALLSERYSDDEGRDRRGLDGILRVYLLRHEAIHVLTRIERIEFPQPGNADVALYVAMAGRPLSAASELANFNADLYRLELRLVEEDGAWRVRRAAWRRAELGEFLP